MTLLRQLIIAILVLFVLLYAGNSFVSLLNTRALVQDQMQVHAQDAATSLAISMTQAARAEDIATLDTLFNAVSDSGFYERIYFRDLEGEIVLDRHFEVDVAGVPRWFVAAVDLSATEGATEGRAEVVSGWLRLGEVVVRSHPGQAYYRLWTVMVQQLVWFAAVTLLVCLLAFVALRYLLRPLQRVEEQANAICNQEFPVQESLPVTRELRRVVEAMNRMALKLHRLFDSQLDLIQRLQSQAYRDAVTGLSNRADFDARLDSLVSDPRGRHSGVLMIFAVGDLARVNELAGRHEGNRLLKAYGQVLSEATEAFTAVVVARRQGPEFSVLVPDISADEADSLAASLFDAIESVAWAQQDKVPLQVTMGFTYRREIDSAAEMLSEADMALRQARSGQERWCRFSDLGEGGDAPVLARPVHDWRQFIQHSLDNNAIQLQYQPVCQGEGKEVVGVEVFTRFLDENNEISAGIVAPIAERLGLAVELDKTVLKALSGDVLSGAGGYYAVNLCTPSLGSEDFRGWLEDYLAADEALAGRLVFEIQETALHTDNVDVAAFQGLLHSHGARLAIDHFGLESSAFGYLSSLPLFYIKVHRSFVKGVEGNPDNQFYIKSLLQLTHSRDIDLIAEGIETDAEWRTALDLGVDAMQGYFLGLPEPIS